MTCLPLVPSRPLWGERGSPQAVPWGTVPFLELVWELEEKASRACSESLAEVPPSLLLPRSIAQRSCRALAIPLLFGSGRLAWG